MSLYVHISGHGRRLWYGGVALTGSSHFVTFRSSKTKHIHTHSNIEMAFFNKILTSRSHDIDEDIFLPAPEEDSTGSDTATEAESRSEHVERNDSGCNDDSYRSPFFFNTEWTLMPQRTDRQETRNKKHEMRELLRLARNITDVSRIVGQSAAAAAAGTSDKSARGDRDLESESLDSTFTEDTDLDTGTLYSDMSIADVDSDGQPIETDMSMMEDLPLDMLLYEKESGMDENGNRDEDADDTTMALEDDDDDELDQDSINALKLSLQCVYLPIQSQINTTFDPSLEATDFAQGIIQVLQHCFESAMNQSVVEDHLKQIAKQRRKYDFTLVTLFRRLSNIGKHHLYARDAFRHQQEFEMWKQAEKSEVDGLLQLATDARRTLSNHLVHICVLRTNISRDAAGLKKNTYDIGMTVHHKFNSRVKRVTMDRRLTSIIINWNKDVFAVGMESPEVINVDFFTRGLFNRKNEFGTLKINIPGLLLQFDTNIPWGKRNFVSQFDVLDTKSGTVIGESNVRITLQFQKFPENSCDVDAAKTDTRKTIKEGHLNPHNLYELLVMRIIKNQPVVEGPDMSSNSVMFSPHEQWLFNELRRLHGITIAHHHIAIIRALEKRLDLVIPYASNIKEIVTVLRNTIPATKIEEQMIHSSMKRFTDRLFRSLSDFTRYFYKRTSELKIFLEVFKCIKLEFENLSEQELDQLVKSLVKQALQSDYESISQTIRFNTEVDSHDFEDASGRDIAQLCLVARTLQKRMTFVSNYSKCLPADINLTGMITSIYYKDNFKREVNAIIDRYEDLSEDEGNSFGVLQLCSELQRLHAAMSEEFGAIDFDLIDASSLGKKYVERYLNGTKLKLIKIARHAIQMEKPLAGVFHSTSVVDLYSAANQYFEVLKNLEFVTSDLLRQFQYVLIDVTEQFCSINMRQAMMMLVSSSQEVANQHRVLIDFAILKRAAELLLNGADASLNLKEDDDEARHVDTQFKITNSFLLKLNNMNAARKQVNLIAEELFKKRNPYYNSYQSNGDSRNFNLLSERMQPILSAPEIDSEDEEADGIEDEILKDRFIKINDTISQVLGVMIKQMQPLFNSIFRSIASLEKEDMDCAGMKKEGQARLKRFFDNVLTPNLKVLNISMQTDIFVQTLFMCYVLAIEEIGNVMFSLDRNQRPCTKTQALLLRSLLQDIFDYFNAAGKGVDVNFAEQRLMFLKQSFALHEMSTETLIEYFEQTFPDPSQYIVERKSGNIGPHHNIMVLQSRFNTEDEDSDRLAKEFCGSSIAREVMDNLMTNIKFRSSGPVGVEEVNFQNPFTGKAILVNDMSSGMFHLYPSCIGFEKDIVGYEALEPVVWIDLQCVESLDQVSTNGPVLLKGFEISLINDEDNAWRPVQKYRFYFPSEHLHNDMFPKLEVRCRAAIEINTQKRQAQRARQAVLDDATELDMDDLSLADDLHHDHDDEESNVGTGWDDELDEMRQDPLSVSLENHQKTDQQKFGIPEDQQLVDQMKTALSRENEGILYVFTCYLCFEPFMSDQTLVLPLERVNHIYRKKVLGKSGRVQVFTKDGDMIEFRRFLQFKKSYKTLSGQLQAYNKLYRNVADSPAFSSMAPSLSNTTIIPTRVMSSVDSQVDETLESETEVTLSASASLGVKALQKHEFEEILHNNDTQESKDSDVGNEHSMTVSEDNENSILQNVPTNEDQTIVPSISNIEQISESQPEQKNQEQRQPSQLSFTEQTVKLTQPTNLESPLRTVPQRVQPSNTFSHSSISQTKKDDLASKFQEIQPKPAKSKKLDKFNKRKEFFFTHFKLDRKEEFYIGTKCTRKVGKRGYHGNIFLGSHHIGFTPNNTKDAPKCEIVFETEKLAHVQIKKSKVPIKLQAGKMLLFTMNDGTVLEMLVGKHEQVLSIVNGIFDRHRR